jgi:ribose transport system permease protein
MYNILDQSAAVGIIAAGGTLVMIAGGLDLSTSAVFALVGVVNASLALEYGVLPALVGSLLTGAFFGSINGLLTTVGRINPIITTLATSIMFRGVAVAVTRGFLIVVPDPNFAFIGRGSIGPIKHASIIFLISIAIVWFILDFTAFGRYIYATGGNREAARLSGVRTELIRFTTFVISGLSAAVAGIVMSSRVSTGQADAGVGMEITAIAAIVIGGTSIAGGEGSAWRTLFGVLLLTLIGNGFNLLNLNPIYQQAFTGLIILVAVAIDAWSRMKQS